MRCARPGLNIIIGALQAEGINTGTGEWLFVLATDAGEQNSYTRNAAHLLVQTKGRCGGPRLSELGCPGDTPGRGVIFLCDALSVPSILSVGANQEPGCPGQIPWRAIALLTGC